MMGALTTILLIVSAFVTHGDAWGTLRAAVAPQPARVLGAATAHTPQRVFPEAALVSTAHAFPLRAPRKEPPQRNTDAPALTLTDAHAAAVLDAATGALLYDQHAHARRAIASLTKLYTAYIVRTSGVALDAPVTIDAASLRTIGSRVGCKSSTVCKGTRLQEGEVLTVRDLLTAMLIVSANDAAAVLARYVAGSEEAFVGLMNRRAKELGLTDSHFCSPNGLEVEGEACYSSAADIGRVAVLAMRDTLLWQLLNTKRAAITSADGRYTHTLEATNHFAQSRDVPGIIGAKTGFTPRAGKSLLAGAAHPQRADTRIVAVLLGDPWRWRDMKTLIEWTWQAYTWR